MLGNMTINSFNTTRLTNKIQSKNENSSQNCHETVNFQVNDEVSFSGKPIKKLIELFDEQKYLLDLLLQNQSELRKGSQRSDRDSFCNNVSLIIKREKIIQQKALEIAKLLLSKGYLDEAKKYYAHFESATPLSERYYAGKDNVEALRGQMRIAKEQGDTKEIRRLTDIITTINYKSALACQYSNIHCHKPLIIR